MKPEILRSRDTWLLVLLFIALKPASSEADTAAAVRPLPGRIASTVCLESSFAGDTFGGDIALSGDTMVVGVPGDDSGSSQIDVGMGADSLTDAGAARVFTRSEDGWVHEAYLKPGDPGEGARFGSSVAISGDTILIGAPEMRKDPEPGATDYESRREAGAAYVFVRDGDSWRQQAKIIAPNADRLDFFGSAVALDGDTAVIAAKGEWSGWPGINGDQFDNSMHYAGAVYVFVRNGDDWNFHTYIKSPAPDSGDYFGSAIAFDGSRIVVGAPYERSASGGVNGDPADNSAGYAGAAYVYEMTDGGWELDAYLKQAEPGPSEQFGSSVALDGDRIAIGARWESRNHEGATVDELMWSGAAFIFVKEEGGWRQEARLKASNPARFDSFGSGLVFGGDFLIVTAHSQGSPDSFTPGGSSFDSYGAAYLFERRESRWVETHFFKPEGLRQGAQFGASPSIDRGVLAVGAPGQSDLGLGDDGEPLLVGDAGAVYLFDVIEPVDMPTLDISMANGSISVSWPASSGAWRLQSSDRLSGDSFTDRETSVIGDRFIHTAPLPAGNQFFRLAR